jgi:hypothetical protein
VANSAESQEEGPNCYVHAVKTGSNKENRAVDVLPSREFYTKLIFICLAEKEGYPQQNRQEQVSREAIVVSTKNVCVRNCNGCPGG